MTSAPQVHTSSTISLTIWFTCAALSFVNSGGIPRIPVWSSAHLFSYGRKPEYLVIKNDETRVQKSYLAPRLSNSAWN
ncbi:hypothetical protein CENSYa_1773 [Cenarchaeum symbiosum A]|uniref:Uncharacterized protein n=1 Tax=Cenarchaeum symbiosum (strain A) TaxID=414004 RepID=A0RYG6_CENSY|nr:hypothetical protein CENSYa_1773 [Cenarchaeum symbiosum A]